MSSHKDETLLLKFFLQVTQNIPKKLFCEKKIKDSFCNSAFEKVFKGKERQNLCKKALTFYAKTDTKQKKNLERKTLKMCLQHLKNKKNVQYQI